MRFGVVAPVKAKDIVASFAAEASNVNVAPLFTFKSSLTVTVFGAFTVIVILVHGLTVRKKRYPSAVR